MAESTIWPRGPANGTATVTERFVNAAAEIVADVRHINCVYKLFLFFFPLPPAN